MSSVWIGEIAGDEDVLRPDLFEQRADDADILRPDSILPNFARLIERQVEEACRAPWQPDRLDPAHRFGFANDAFDVLDLGDVDFAGTLPIEERIHGRGERFDLRLFDQRIAGGSDEKVDVATNVVVKDGNVAAGLIRDRDLVLVLHQFSE